MTTKVHKIAILSGDGIGPEVVDATLMVLDAVQKTGLVHLEYLKGDAGFDAIKKYGTNVTALKPGIDLIVVRENTEGLYSGKEFEVTPGVAVAMKIITRTASERIAKFALELAMKRRKKLAFVHKANILKITDGLFKQSVLNVAKDYPEVELEDLHIDAAAMQLIRRPESFDVIVTTNLFGDILSDEAAALVGGLGVAAGANIGENYGMFEPVGGSAPKYTGQNKVNPVATIEAAKMMLDYLGESKAANVVEKATTAVLKEGKVMTYDLGGNARTSDMGKAIAEKVMSLK